MGLKMKTALLIPAMLAMFLLISLEVAASYLKEDEVVRATNRVGVAKLVVGGGGGLPSPGFPARGLPSPGFPGRGSPSSGFPGRGFPNQGFPNQGFPNQGFPNQGFPNQGFPNQGFPNQGFPRGGYPGQNFPGQGFQAQASCRYGCCNGDGRGCLSCCSPY